MNEQILKELRELREVVHAPQRLSTRSMTAVLGAIATLVAGGYFVANSLFMSRADASAIHDKARGERDLISRMVLQADTKADQNREIGIELQRRLSVQQQAITEATSAVKVLEDRDRRRRWKDKNNVEDTP